MRNFLPAGMFRFPLVLILFCLAFFRSAAAEPAATADGVRFRLPEPAEVSEKTALHLRTAWGIQADPLLNAAFTLLEEGNPFLIRYNEATGETVRPRLPYGVPYFWGGRAESHVFAKEPDYVVQECWSDSPVYFRAGRKYLYGFDCFGVFKWLWPKARGVDLPSADEMFAAREWWIPGPSAETGASCFNLDHPLEPGDLLLMEHSGRHIAMYIGSLRMYGYTEEEVPELRDELDTPLVLHSSVNASIAFRFDRLIAEGLPKYRTATVTDGGVCVSLLCDDPRTAPLHVCCHDQNTDYYLLPDDTWLTVLPLSNATRTRWVRLGADLGK